MNHILHKLVVALVLCFICTNVLGKAGEDSHYSEGSLISEQVMVFDADGKPHQLLSLIEKEAKPVNVVFIFGGGGLGHERTRATGGLWCPDSFEDLHILRSLNAAYGDKVGIFPIAVPPAHHSQHLGYTEGVFFNPDVASAEYQNAVAAFVDSTQGAFASGTIPVQPFYDTHFNFMISQEDIARRESSEAWSGAFRANNEPQTYGVPSLWVVGQDGRVLHEPFRGNNYHAHGDKITINYTLENVVDALESREGNKL